MPLSTGTRLGAYEIDVLIGAGGFGEVYKARDTRLGRTVAIKVLPSTDPELKARFEREAQAIANLHHPHICTLFDVGRENEVDYLVLEYLDGETLAARLKRGRLDTAAALEIAGSIAEALERAHTAGIVHRDLKPANVMVTSNGVKLLDFGLAKLRSPVTPPAATLAPTQWTPGVTSRGTVLGTIEYMSPEQLEGREADARSDIWAFGCVLYELLTGVRLFDAPRGRQLAVRPKYLEPVINKCLEPDPGDRWTSIRDVRDALKDTRPASRYLKWSAAAVAGAALMALLSVGYLRWRAPAPVERQPLTILVADFANTTGESVFDGVIDRAVAVALESSSYINVYARRDAMNAAVQIGRSTNLDETTTRLVARREGVPMLVTGRIVPNSGGYELSAAAIESVSGTPVALVTEKVAANANVLTAVARLTEQLRAAIGDAVVSGSGDLARETFTTSSLEAAKAYTTAQDLAFEGKDEDAARYYQEAVRIDPEFGRAYSGWAATVDRIGRPKESEALFQKAISLLARMNRRERLRTEGFYVTRSLQDYARGRDIFQTLLAEFPADMVGHNNLAVTEFNLLNFDRAWEVGQRVVTLWPSYVQGRSNLALYAMYSGRFDAAVEQAKEAIRLSDKATTAFIPLGVAAVVKGRDDEGVNAYHTMSRTGSRGAWLAELALADLDAARGRTDEAERRLRARVEQDERDGNTAAAVRHYALLAELAAGRQRTAEVVRFVERGRRMSSEPQFTYRFALALVDVGRRDEARKVAEGLRAVPHARSAVYRRLIGVELGPATDYANEILRTARETGMWWAYYRAAIVLTRARAPEAKEALRWCLDHRSQGVAAFLDDVPTLRHYVAVGALSP